MRLASQLISVFDGYVTQIADCPSDSVVTGGGFYANFSTIKESRQQGNGWLVIASTAGVGGPAFAAYATCLRFN